MTDRADSCIAPRPNYSMFTSRSKAPAKFLPKKFHQLFSNSCHKNVQIPKFSVNSAARCILQGRFSYNAEKNMELDRLPHLKSAAP